MLIRWEAATGMPAARRILFVQSMKVASGAEAAMVGSRAFQRLHKLQHHRLRHAATIRWSAISCGCRSPFGGISTAPSAFGAMRR